MNENNLVSFSDSLTNPLSNPLLADSSFPVLSQFNNNVRSSYGQVVDLPAFTQETSAGLTSEINYIAEVKGNDPFIGSNGQNLLVGSAGQYGFVKSDPFTTQNSYLFEQVSRDWFNQFNQVSQEAYPLIGIIDSNFSASNGDINYNNLILGRDNIENDNNPLSSIGSSSEHGTNVLGIIGATRNNSLGIDGLNDKATIWLSSAIGSGKWADSVIEFVDKAKALNVHNAVLNLSFELTQINPDGSVAPRTELTTAELAALDYAQRNKVIIVAAAGNSAVEQMSALGKASQVFDNIITVGAADGYKRAAYSNFGENLDILAQGGTFENPIFSLTSNSNNLDGIVETYGTSIATAKVTGAISHVWGINPNLNYSQVIDVLKHSAKDIGSVGWDADTGFGLLNIGEAVKLAQNTQPQAYLSANEQRSLLDIKTWSSVDGTFASERGVIGGVVGGFVDKVVDTVKPVVKPVVDPIQQAISAGRQTLDKWINNGKTDLKNFGSDLDSLITTAKKDLGNLRSYGSFADSLSNEISSLYDRVFKAPIENAKGDLNKLNLTQAFKDILNQGGNALNTLYDKWFAPDIQKLTNLGKNYSSLLSNPQNILADPLSTLRGIIKNQGELILAPIESQANTILNKLKATSASDFVDLFSPNSNNSVVKAWNDISSLQKSGNDLFKTVSESYQKQKTTFTNALNSLNTTIYNKKVEEVTELNRVSNLLRTTNYSKAFSDAYDQFNKLLVTTFNNKVSEARGKIPNITNLINQGNSSL